MSLLSILLNISGTLAAVGLFLTFGFFKFEGTKLEKAGLFIMRAALLLGFTVVVFRIWGVQ